MIYKLPFLYITHYHDPGENSFNLFMKTKICTFQSFRVTLQKAKFVLLRNFASFFTQKLQKIPAPVCAWWVIFAVSKICVHNWFKRERKKLENPQLLECFLVVYKTIPSTSKQTLVELARKRWRVWWRFSLYLRYFSTQVFVT